MKIYFFCVKRQAKNNFLKDVESTVSIKYFSGLQDTGVKVKPNVRTCFHPGASTLEPNVVKGVEDEVKGRDIVKKMLNYVWPKDKPGIRTRVIVALGLLVGSKVSSAQQEVEISQL